MTDSPIDCLRTTLLEDIRRDPRGKGVARLLGEYAGREGDWRTWALFDPERYTRNLVHRCADYELLLLGWGEGQESPIHDHAGQQCWMAVLDGDVEEVHFRQGDEGEPLKRGAVRRFARGQVAYIEDEIALHLVRPARGRAVSLHLYSNPIDTCRIYDPVTGAASRLDVGYHSVRGRTCGDRSPEAVRAEFA